MTTQRLYANTNKLFEFLSSQGFNFVAPVDVDDIAKRLDIKVIEDPDLENRNSIGEISFLDNKPIIRINPIQNSYNPRRRFTLAHEIGHYCLHSSLSKEGFKDSMKTMSRSDSYWDTYESEANGFAAQLLMPKALIIKEGSAIIFTFKEKYNVDSISVSVFVEEMASLFEVSNRAMQYRLKALKIIVLDRDQSK